jgi:hypothetical protein
MITRNIAIEKFVGLENGKLKIPERVVIRQTVKEAFYKERDDYRATLPTGRYVMAVLDHYAGYFHEPDFALEVLNQTLPVIEQGINHLNEITTKFVDSIPEESIATKMIEQYGRCCLNQPIELQDGSRVALLRGETSEKRTAGSRQYGYVITDSGEVFKVRAREIEDQTKCLETRSLKHILASASLAEVTEMVQMARDDTHETGYVLNSHSRMVSSMTLERINLSTQSGQEDFAKFLVNSQKRAVMTAYDLGKNK